jgi:hypothetical protein
MQSLWSINASPVFCRGLSQINLVVLYDISAFDLNGNPRWWATYGTLLERDNVSFTKV